MYRAILIAVDDSAISDRALREGLALARDQHAELRIIHVVDTMPPATRDGYVDFDAYKDAVLQVGHQVLAHVAVLVRDAGASATPSLLEANGVSPAAAILEEAKRWPADLIVIGTHGREGLQHLLMGSVAEGILRHADLPVLLIHATHVD